MNNWASKAVHWTAIPLCSIAAGELHANASHQRNPVLPVPRFALAVAQRC